MFLFLWIEVFVLPLQLKLAFFPICIVRCNIEQSNERSTFQNPQLLCKSTTVLDPWSYMKTALLPETKDVAHIV